jgi:MFS family permease
MSRTSRTERRFYFLQGSYSAWGFVLGPVYPLFLLSLGLDLLQASTVLATYFLVTFVFEVPTGAVADVFGRRLSFVLACAARTTAFALYFFAEDFLDCLVAEVIDAIGSTLASGALEAWAVDEMRREGRKGPIDRIFARAQIAARLLVIIGGIIGGVAADIDIALPWTIGATGFALTGLAGLFLMQEPIRTHPRGRSRTSVGEAAIAGLDIARTFPLVRLLCLLSAAAAAGIMPAHFLWPAHLESLLADPSFWLLSWIWALVNLTAAVGGLAAARLPMHWKRQYVLAGTCTLRALGIGIAALTQDFGIALCGLIVMEFGIASGLPAYQAWLNEGLPDHLRATVLSVANMSFTMGGATSLLVMGVLARSSGIPTAWSLCALILAALAPAYLLLPIAARRRGDNPSAS